MKRLLLHLVPLITLFIMVTIFASTIAQASTVNDP
jgi:hypothetical protein